MTDISLRAVRKTACPSCGAEVPIHTRAAVQAVCPYCRSTLVRKDLQWEDVGKMAALAEDLSPIRLGMTGRYGKIPFTVIGRLQKQYEDGFWNEWLLALPNNRSAWLGEGSGLFYFTTATTSIVALPAFSSLAPGQQVKLNNISYTVTDIEQATCVATEGEIPFAIRPGSSAHAVDCTGPDGEFATLDYSEFPPQLYTGDVLTPDELALDGVTALPLAEKKTEALRCQKCGSAMAKLSPESVTLVCASCCAVHSRSPKGKLVMAWEQAQRSLRPRLPLGRRGTLQGHEYEVIGWMRRRSSGDSWDEYLLFHPTQGLRWLIEAAGHWTFMQSIPSPGAYGAASASDGQRSYKHFATYNATCSAVLGEFNWRVRKDERWTVTDFVAPPWILCRESSGKEITWSRGEYLDADLVARAFGLQKLAPPKGVAPCQPGPRIGSVLAAFVVTMVIAHYLEKAVHAGEPPLQTLRMGTLVLPANSNSAALTSEPFELTAPRGALRVQTSTNLSNHWAGFDYSLVNQGTGEVREMSRELSYYWGSDADGPWSEGRTYDEALFSAVPAGRYVLEAEAGTESYDWRGNPREVITANVTVDHPAPTGNWWALFWFLALGPFAAILWRLSFEQKRWADSDHPWSSE